MARSNHFVALVAAVGVLAAAGSLVLIVLAVQGRSAEATAPGHDGNDSEIYTIGPGGGGTLKVTDNDTEDFSPAYSPDGTDIAYVGNDGNDLEIYTKNVRTGGTLKVTDNDTDDLYPSYSPSGLTIAYEGYDGNDSEI